MKVPLVMMAVLALVAGGCDQKKETAQKAATAPEAGSPPLTNGVFVVRDACPGEGCDLETFYWRAKEQVPLREKPDAAARIVTTVAPKELVRALGSELSVVPWRGVVTADEIGLKKGEIVWLTDYVGEGVYNLWRGGKEVDFSDQDHAFNVDEAKIKWDKPLDAVPKEKWWVRLERKNGQSGWVLDPSFECANLRAGDDGCVDVK